MFIWYLIGTLEYHDKNSILSKTCQQYSQTEGFIHFYFDLKHILFFWFRKFQIYINKHNIILSGENAHYTYKILNFKNSKDY